MSFALDSADCSLWVDIIQRMAFSIFFRSMNAKWLDTPDLKKYEAYILDWHNFLIDVQEVFYQSEDETLIKNLNMYVLNRFFLTAYQEGEDFYSQFYQRMEETKKLLSLGV